LPLKEGGREGGKEGGRGSRATPIHEGGGGWHALLPALPPSLPLPQSEIFPEAEDFVFMKGEVEKARA